MLDVGCGTGTFGCLLAHRGIEVTGLDPAGESLAVARSKPGAERVRWLHGDATDLPPLQVDLATMTGNVAQVFCTDDDWDGTLVGVRAALRPGGHLVFETWDPAKQAWTSWNRADTYSRTALPGGDVVTSWSDVTSAAAGLASFQTTFEFASDGAVMTSSSTLRFRERAEVERSLAAAGFGIKDVRNAPDRPGQEFVFVTRGDPPRPNLW